MIKPRKAVLEMEEYKPPTSGRENLLRLDFNENTIGCSPKLVKALKKIKPNSLATYPEYNELRRILANYCNVAVSQLITTNGTDEAIKTIVESYIEKGKDEIIIPVPTYAMFKFYAQLNEAIIKEIEYNEDLSFPTDKILDAINGKTKIVVLVNPNNPTGTSIRLKDIVRIIQKAKQNNAVVLLDEAYYEFFGKTCVSLIKKYPNLLILRTFSKAFGLAGLRIGYIISSNSNIKILKKVLSPYSVSQIAIICAIAALKDKDYAMNYANKVNKCKKLLYKELTVLGIEYYKSDANFILLRIGKKANSFCKFFRKNGILVRNRSADVLLNGCIRITVGTLSQSRRVIALLRKFQKVAIK